MKYTKRTLLGAIAACAMFTAAPAYADLRWGWPQNLMLLSPRRTLPAFGLAGKLIS